ncbi:PAS domain S-box protein [Saccharicrinis sp. FJH62]|uniref:PAS domain-containing protein n=1 Tax=Saccharicrinis sp. FJH62 TaxID=3344657 RepID=UPI0035D4A3EF
MKKVENKGNKRSRVELRIVITFLIVGVLWIIGSDFLVSLLTTDPRIQTYKGLIFVILTTILIYFLVRKESVKQDKIKAQIKLKELEYEHLIENQDDLLVKVDKQGRFLYINEKYCSFFGKSKEELLNQSFMPLVHEDDRHSTTLKMEELYKPPYKTVVQQRVYTPDGWKWLEWKDTAIVNDKDEVYEIIAIGRDITDKKEVEFLIRAAHEELETFFALTPDLSCIVKSDGTFLKVNKSWERILGYSIDELLNTSFTELIHPEDLNDTMLQIDQQKTGKSVKGFINRYRCKSGTYRTFEWMGTPPNQEGIMYAVARDITERIKMDRELKESEEKYRKLFEQSNDPVLLIEGEKFIECNQATVKLLEYNSKKDIVGKHPWDLSPEFQPDGQPSYKKAVDLIEEALKSGYSRFEWVHQKKGGRNLWIEVSLTPLKERGVDIIYTNWRDITKRKQYEKELQTSQRNFEIIAENTSDFILIVDPNFLITYVSPSVNQVLGYSHEEITNKNILLFVHSDDVAYVKNRIMEERQKNIFSSTFINKARKKDGTEIWIELSIERIINSNNKQEYSVCIGRDVTERIKHEEELKHALAKARESDKLKSSFLANMSHEIRTPLNGIIGFSEILATDSEMDEETRHSYSNIIRKSSNQLLSILNDILDISKIESQQIDLTIVENEINTLLNDIYDQFKPNVEAKGLDFKLIIPKKAGKLKVMGDNQRILQIFGNLLTNAIKFTSSGSIEIGIEQLNNEWVFFVADTGKGIKDEYKETVWDRFIQGDRLSSDQHGGTGLGLSICKSLTELMHGKIWLTSEYGKGSTFYFTLPKKRV